MPNGQKEQQAHFGNPRPQIVILAWTDLPPTGNISAMFKWLPILLVGLLIAAWARSMTHDDRIVVGLKTHGQIVLRGAMGNYSISANEGLYKLGEKYGLAWQSSEIKVPDSIPTGPFATFKKPMDWEIRAPVIVFLFVLCFWFYLKLKVG